MGIKVYLVYGPSGEYDTYYEELIGVFLNSENAQIAGEKWYKRHTDFSNAPMSLSEYEDLNEGYAEDDYDHEGPRGRDGYSEADFEKMDEIWESEFETYYQPIYKEAEIQDVSSIEDLLKFIDSKDEQR